MAGLVALLTGCVTGLFGVTGPLCFGWVGVIFGVIGLQPSRPRRRLIGATGLDRSTGCAAHAGYRIAQVEAS